MVAEATATLHELYFDLLTSAILFAGVTWLFHKPNATHLPIANAAVLGLLAAFTYSGWQFLRRQLPELWIGSGIVWLVYSTTKLIASFFIGVIVGPFQVIRSVYQLHSARKLRRRILMSRA